MAPQQTGSLTVFNTGWSLKNPDRQATYFVITDTVSDRVGARPDTFTICNSIQTPWNWKESSK